MTIKRHPAPENLMSCAAGSMPEALAAVMACHVSMCPDCGKDLSILEVVGGALLEDMAPQPFKNEMPSPAIEPPQPVVRKLADGAGDVPAPLRKYVGPHLGDIKWRRVAPGIWQYPIPLSEHSNASLRLIKVSPGLAIPDHGHSGAEMTLLLQGVFTDEFGTYQAGDVIEMDEGIVHAPVAAEGEECICLIASEGSMQFRSILARLVQRWTGF